MSYKNMMVSTIVASALLFAGNANSALSFYKKDGLLQISGESVKEDVAKLKAQLTPDIKTILLYAPTGSSWAVARDLASLVEDAKVTTVARGTCHQFTCSMIFLAGKERMFSASTRPEASSISLAISTEYFPPDAGDDASRPWLDVTTWWRDHTNLSRTEMWPRHQPFVRPPGIHPVENLVYFHPSAKTSKGSAVECFGKQQTLPFCVAMPNSDALKAGIITTLERFVAPDQTGLVKDIAVPTPTTFAAIDEIPLKVAKVNDNCNTTYKEFLTYDSPRAFVVSSGGGCYFSTAQHLTPYDAAMDRCKKAVVNRNGMTCRFYAVDDKVVFTEFNSTEPKWTGSSSSSMVFDPANVQIKIGRGSERSTNIVDQSAPFGLEGKITIQATFNWTSTNSPGDQRVEVRWYIGDKLTHTSGRTNNFNASPYVMKFSPLVTEIGIGAGRADVYANGNLVGSKPFTILDKVSASSP